jgi:hypothetical protein
VVTFGSGGLSGPPVGSKLAADKEGDAIVPFDGTSVRPNSPLAILLEADRKLTQEHRAAALPRRRPVSREEQHRQRRAQARATIEVLDQLEVLFADGRNWLQRSYQDGAGRFCLIGGLRHVRAGVKTGDLAGIYLSQAIAKTVGARLTLMGFNDSYQRKFADIRFVICRARELAQQVADGRP